MFNFSDLFIEKFKSESLNKLFVNVVSGDPVCVEELAGYVQGECEAMLERELSADGDYSRADTEKAARKVFAKWINNFVPAA